MRRFGGGDGLPLNPRLAHHAEAWKPGELIWRPKHAQNEDLSRRGKKIHRAEERKNKEKEGLSQPYPDQQVHQAEERSEAGRLGTCQGCRECQKAFAVRLDQDVSRNLPADFRRFVSLRS